MNCPYCNTVLITNEYGSAECNSAFDNHQFFVSDTGCWFLTDRLYRIGKDLKGCYIRDHSFAYNAKFILRLPDFEMSEAPEKITRYKKLLLFL
jgi:hypothetical protein